ncbi:MAG: hypothetical protein NVS4B3_05160 [Gemmatimonadaceae bacterium]
MGHHRNTSCIEGSGASELIAPTCGLGKGPVHASVGKTADENMGGQGPGAYDGFRWSDSFRKGGTASDSRYASQERYRQARLRRT